jgi:hypothetical protein
VAAWNQRMPRADAQASERSVIAIEIM